MLLGKFKEKIEKLEKGTMFNYSLSDPFSWRGSYDEVCFTITTENSTREELLEKINKALSEEFYGYKGGKYAYGEKTWVNFEDSYSAWSDGGYARDIIEKITDADKPDTIEEELVNLIFN